MTYGEVKILTSALLSGDYVVPEENDKVLMLLKYAFLKIATEADALKLFTVDRSDAILREGKGNTFIRMPNTPEEDDDQLDIDDELGYPAARFIASFISKEDKKLHEFEANELIRAYNSKVDSFLAKKYDSQIGAQ